MKKTEIFEQVVEIMRERRHQSPKNGMWIWKSVSTIAKTHRISKRFFVFIISCQTSQCKRVLVSRWQPSQ